VAAAIASLIARQIQQTLIQRGVLWARHRLRDEHVIVRGVELVVGEQRLQRGRAWRFGLAHGHLSNRTDDIKLPYTMYV
jgi:hypothetical protein